MRRLLALCLAVAAIGVPAGARAHDPSVGARAEAPGNFPIFLHERIRIPMRDGVTLSADVWRPVTEQHVPVIIQMTPYHWQMKAFDRNEDDLPTDLYATWFVKRGYAWVIVDVRGTYNSGGCWDYGGLVERHDGFDTVEYLGTRDWSNGRVAMIGGSYDGTTANMTAIEQPPHLATIVPISAISRWYDYAYEDGARITGSGDQADADPPLDTPADFMTEHSLIPPPDPARLDDPVSLGARFTLCDRAQQTSEGYLDGRDSEFWRARDYLAQADRVQVPVLITHGFLDGNVKTSQGLRWFEALPGTKMLVVGQWPHALPIYTQWRPLLTRWFDRYLYDVPTGIEDEPPVRVQAAGTSGFESRETYGGAFEDIALAGTESYLDDGLQTETITLASPAPDARIPVLETFGGRQLEGGAFLDLSFRSSQPSTRFAAYLCVIRAGTCTVFTRAFGEARYLTSAGAITDLVPGQTYTARLRFHHTSVKLQPSDTLEVWLTGSALTWIASDPMRATVSIDLDGSTLRLPVR